MSLHIRRVDDGGARHLGLVDGCNVNPGWRHLPILASTGVANRTIPQTALYDSGRCRVGFRLPNV